MKLKWIIRHSFPIAASVPREVHSPKLMRGLMARWFSKKGSTPFMFPLDLGINVGEEKERTKAAFFMAPAMDNR